MRRWARGTERASEHHHRVDRGDWPILDQPRHGPFHLDRGRLHVTDVEHQPSQLPSGLGPLLPRELPGGGLAQHGDELAQRPVPGCGVQRHALHQTRHRRAADGTAGEKIQE